ncbi:P-loop containing nucleoside triphosphate hydrolase protein [Obelidium mucronatum]|nr:P-loop containing nucleoside triphosphate hydrolase protein [Obelidium mucronatum]
MVQCRTMHGAAMRYMVRPSEDFPINPVDDHEIMKRIERDYGETVPFNARIKTVCYYIFKTFFGTRRADPVTKLTDPWMTYYPAKKKHTDDYKFEPGRFYVDIANEIWTKMWTGQFPINHDAYLKYAQLGNFRLPPYITTTPPPANWISLLSSFATNAKNLQTTPRNVFIVGDAAQSIYYFRGARPKELAQIQTNFDASTPLKDFPLTKSFRFGPVVAKRSGLKLIMKGLEVFAEHKISNPESPVKIAINGNAVEYKTKMEDALDVFRLSIKERPKHPKFSEWDTFEEFQKDVEDREMGEYIMMLRLIENYKEQTPNVIREFEDSILSKKYSVQEADVILTTAHQAKGLEYDNVEVSDDFIELDTKEKIPEKANPYGSQFTKGTQVKTVEKQMEFKLNGWGDDLNLWYVAVTRPKKLLKLPDKWWGIMDFMQKVQEGTATHQFDGKQLLKPEDAVALKKLFDTLDPYLLGGLQQ